jgi:hypothetical protein
MKKLFISLLAVAALASCAKEDVIVADPGELIAFNSFVENSTRAAVDPSYGQNGQALKAFKVWGTVNGGNGLVNIFNGANVTGTVGTDASGKPNVWTCDVKQYWIKDATYNFAALVNATNDLTVVNGLPTVVKGFTANGETDLLYARSEEDIVGLASGNGPVNFDFQHLLSKVKFTVVNNSKAAEAYSFKVNGITITGNSVGNVALASKEWSNLGTPKSYSVKEISVNKNTADAGEECEQELLLIPGDYTINFNVDIYNGTTKLGSQTYPVAGGSYAKTLAVGNAYNFVITVAVGEEIKFSVEKQPTWTDGGNITLQ